MNVHLNFNFCTFYYNLLGTIDVNLYFYYIDCYLFCLNNLDTKKCLRIIVMNKI